MAFYYVYGWVYVVWQVRTHPFGILRAAPLPFWMAVSYRYLQICFTSLERLTTVSGRPLAKTCELRTLRRSVSTNVTAFHHNIKQSVQIIRRRVCQATSLMFVCVRSGNYKIVLLIQHERTSLERYNIFRQPGVASPLPFKYIWMCMCNCVQSMWLSCIWAIQNAKHLNLTWVLNCKPQANKGKPKARRWNNLTVTNKSSWRMQIDICEDIQSCRIQVEPTEKLSNYNRTAQLKLTLTTRKISSRFCK